MTTNLLISYPDIPFRGTPSNLPTAATNYSTKNVYTGSRGATFKRSTAGTSTSWDFDLGSGVTAQPDHIIIARADLVRKKDSASTTWTVSGSASASITSPETKTDTFDTSDLDGPGGEDLISEFTYASAFRYWRFTLATTASIACEFSKLHIGNFLDLGRDPLWSREVSRPFSPGHTRRDPYVFQFEWQGITNTKRNLFFDYVVQYAENPIFLYAKTNTVTLAGQSLLHARLIDFSEESVAHNVNTITATFEECI